MGIYCPSCHAAGNHMTNCPTQQLRGGVAGYRCQCSACGGLFTSTSKRAVTCPDCMNPANKSQERQHVSDAAWELCRALGTTHRHLLEKVHSDSGTVLLTVAEHDALLAAEKSNHRAYLVAHEQAMANGARAAELRAEVERLQVQVAGMTGQAEGYRQVIGQLSGQLRKERDELGGTRDSGGAGGTVPAEGAGSDLTKVRAPYSTMPPIKGKPWDFAGKLRQGLQEIRDGLYEHGLKGPQATSYTEAQREHAEPVVDAVEQLLDELLEEYLATEEVQSSKADGHGQDPQPVATGGALADASVSGGMGRQALLRSLRLGAGIEVSNPRLGNRYTGG